MADIYWSTPHIGSSEAVTNIEVLWITDSIFVVCWINSARTTAYASVYNSNGTHLHSQSLFSDSFYQYHQIQLAKVRDNMWVLAYSEDSGFDTTRLRSFTWTGSSITDNGQITVLNSQETRLAAVCNEGEDKIMLWGRRFSLANILYCQYGTYNGSSWSFGSFSSISGSYYANEIRACTASNNKGFLLWDRDPGADTKCHAFVTTAGGGTDITDVDGTDELRHIHCCKLDEDKIIITGHCPDEPDGGRAYAVTISSNKPTIGTRLVFNPDNVSWNPNCSRIDNTHVLIAFEDATDGGKGKTVLCEVDWNTLTITPGDTEIFSENDIGGGGAYGLGMDTNSDGLIALSYRDESDSNYLKTMIGTQSSPIIDIDSTCTVVTSVSSEQLIVGLVEALSSINIVVSDTTSELIVGKIEEINAVCNIVSDSTSYLSTSPPIPENVTVTVSGVYTLLVDWDAVLDATSYNVYWDTTSGGPYNNKISGITNSYYEITLVPGIMYYFVVTSENWVGESGYSLEVSASLSRYSEFTYAPLPSDLSSILSGLISAGGDPISYEALTSRPTSRSDRRDKLNELADYFSETLPLHFLYDSSSTITQLLTEISPDLKSSIDSYFSTGEGDVALSNLLRTMDDWIQDDDNVGSSAPVIEIVLRGLGFSEQQALLELVNFFKPYRSRLVFIGSTFSIDNILTESLIMDDSFNQYFDMELTFGYDYITNGDPPCDNPRADETITLNREGEPTIHTNSLGEPIDSTSTEFYEIVDDIDEVYNHHTSDSTASHYENWEFFSDSTSEIESTIISDGFWEWDHPDSYFDEQFGCDIVTIIVSKSP